MNYVYLETPIGKLLLAGDKTALRAIQIARPAPEPSWEASSSPVLVEAARQLIEYFAGKRREFDLPLAPEGTEFQRTVWRTLEQIPYGVTITYSELASRVGNPKAFRAAGSANGANPIPIVIPCHRVIAVGGKLGGYSGGLAVKEHLLELEGARVPLARTLF